MALSEGFVDAHIARWQELRASKTYPHRKHWPAHLFHHAPLENALLILRDGCIRSRNDPANARPVDVAAPGVIDAREHAHDRVRLYFRPKTPTQWHIEGVRKAGECAYGEGAHAPVLVMFVLDARAVLLQPDILFSNQNMQLGGTVPGSTEQYFSEIPFEKVFSEGGTGGDRSIIDARCAEVLPSSPLRLENCLKAIYFRSDPERDTILHMLGDHRAPWDQYFHVSDDLRVFQKDYAFLQELRLTSEGVIFRVNGRSNGGTVDVAINLFDQLGAVVGQFRNATHQTFPPAPFQNWIWKRPLPNGKYIVEVLLEGHVACRAPAVVGDSLF